MGSEISATRGSIMTKWLTKVRVVWKPANLDIAFDEDYNQIRKNNGVEKFSSLRYIAMNLLKQEKT